MARKDFSSLRAVAHLLEQLGEERFSALVDSANTGKVKEFCEKILVEGPLPDRIKTPHRTYEFYNPLRDDENAKDVSVFEIFRRVVQDVKDIALDSTHLDHLRDYNECIPIACKGEQKVFIFPYNIEHFISKLNPSPSSFTSSQWDLCHLFSWDFTTSHWAYPVPIRLSEWKSNYRFLRRLD